MDKGKSLNWSRREAMGVLGGALGAGAAASLVGTSAFAAVPAPSSPLHINIVDVAGNLALTQKAIEAYAKEKPKYARGFSFNKAPAPELPAKLKAQQNANRVDIDLVLTGTDALSAGIAENLWVPIFPTYKADFPNLDSTLLPPAAKMQTLAQDQGVIVTYYPSGPLIEYAPERVKTVPTSADELLAWAKANPKKFLYARPANSGPGRTFLMGLPYLLGDKDPMDPIHGWDKTWAYLKEIGQYIEYYPTGTGPTMKELGDGTRDIIVSTTGWDINPRALGIVPKSARIGALKGFHWVADAHYMCIPKGVAKERLPVILDLMAFLLKPKEQAYTYDEGYFYPGPAVKGVTLAMAPASSQKVIAEYGRPEYDKLIADNPIELPLPAEKMVAAFDKWDQTIGQQKTGQ